MINLTGNSSSVGMVFSERVVVSGKTMAVFGELEIVSAPRTTEPWTVLSQSVIAGNNSIRIQATAIDWKSGDSILIASSNLNPENYEIAIIKELNDDVITFEQPLVYDHLVTSSNGIDMQPEVSMLNRTIILQGSEVNPSFLLHL